MPDPVPPESWSIIIEESTGVVYLRAADGRTIAELFTRDDDERLRSVPEMERLLRRIHALNLRRPALHAEDPRCSCYQCDLERLLARLDATRKEAGDA